MPAKLEPGEILKRLYERGFILVGEYINTNTHTKFECSNGHQWSARPRYIINEGWGCPHCAGNAKLTKEVIQKRLDGRGIKLLGDKTNANSRVIFECSEGHKWQAQINTVLNKFSGCPHCSGNAHLNTEIVNQRLKPRGIQMISPYQGTKKRSLFRCQYGHEWEVGLASVLGGNACPCCYRERQRSTSEEFIEKAKTIHGEKYDYSKSEYITKRTKLEIICKHHGSYWQLPEGHLKGNGCKKCVFDELRLTTEEFIHNAILKHGNKYDYSKVIYKTNHDKVEIICKEHGSFWQTPNNHTNINGETGCPGCAVSGFDQTKPGILYYIAVLTDNNETLYKIGITNLTVEKRFPNADLARMRIIKTWSFIQGAEAAIRESKILKENFDDLYKGPEVLIGAGNTELFTRDILNLDYEESNTK
jgi:hypothetical protein